MSEGFKEKGGGKEKDRFLRPLEAFKDANFARETNEIEPDDHEAARCGYLMEPYVDAGPATNNLAIRNTVASRGSLGNDGTSRNSYFIQPDLVDADDPLDEDGGNEGTGEPGDVGRKKVHPGRGKDREGQP